MPQRAKTIKEHLLHGTVPQGTPDKPSQFAGGRPKYPRHLSPIARAEFKRAVQMLEQRKTITPGDYTTLAVYAEVFARWIQAKNEIGDSLMVETTVTDNNGNLRTVRRLNPLLKVAQSCEARMLALVKALGLTPVDREKARPTTSSNDTPIVPGSVGWMLLHGDKEKKGEDDSE
jgi:P27 family predicted phage terminase small subunit